MGVNDLVNSLLSLGLVGVFSITLLEKFVPVVPSYVLLLLLGMTAPDWPTLALIIMVTALGSLGGSIGWFAIGRFLGERRVETAIARFGRYVFFPIGTYRRLADSYRRNRFKVTLLGQTVPVARVYLGLPAGVLRLATGSFVPAALLGILLWNIPFVTLGFVLRNSGHAPADIGLVTSVILIATEIFVFVLIPAVRRLHSNRITS